MNADLRHARLEFEVCPNCGLHAEVRVTVGEMVIQRLEVMTTDEALDIHDEFVEDGGPLQPEFLAQVEASSLRASPRGAMLLLVALFGGVDLRVRTTTQPMDYTRGQLTLERCQGCGRDGRVYLERPGSAPQYVRQAFTKAEAYDCLNDLVQRGLPEQPEFLQAVAAADWLQD